MTHSTKAPCDYGNRLGSTRGRPSGPRDLNQKNNSRERIYDLELAQAIRVAKERLGADDPLLAKALRSLRAKERRRVNGAGDALTAEIAPKGHARESELARLLTEILGEPPIREATVSGFGRCRVDMYFLGHALVVEENGERHGREDVKTRDAALRRICKQLDLRLLEVDYREPLTREHLLDRLRRVGVGIDNHPSIR